MQVANVKLRQILPRVGKIWVSTPQNRTIGVNLGVFAGFYNDGCDKHAEEIRRNTQAIRRNTLSKTPQAKTPYRA